MKQIPLWPQKNIAIAAEYRKLPGANRDMKSENAPVLTKCHEKENIMKKNRIFLAVVFCLLFCLSACKDKNPGDDASKTPTETEQNVTMTPTTPVQEEAKMFEFTEENVRPIGRTFSENGLWCAFSGSGAEFQFHGNKLIVNVIGDNAAKNPFNEDNHTRIAIYVNGERVIDEMVNEAVKAFTVFDGSETVDAVVNIVKLSETAMSTIKLSSLITDGAATVTPTKPRDLYIEFIGDSITCGYGVDDEDRDHHFSTKTEDCTKAYAYKTAKLLNADYSLVSISGYGIITGYSGDGEKKSESQIIPKYYEKLGFSYANSVMAKTDWDFTKREPDAVVINLGTNDDSWCKKVPERQEEYIAGYVAFLKTIREKNPNATIVCALGIMGDNLYPCVEAAVTRYREETGDTNVEAFHFTPQNPADGYAADWHPTAVTHTKAAEKIAERLREILK